MSLDDVLATACERLTSRGWGRTYLAAVDGIDGAGKTTFADQLALALEQRGRHSPDGYYRDSFDIDAFARLVLDFGDSKGGPFAVVKRVFDLAGNKAVMKAPVAVGRGGIVLCDGVFLQRPAFAGRWDFVVYLHINAEERYLPAQQFYFDEISPDRSADPVIDNNDVSDPHVVACR